MYIKKMDKNRYDCAKEKKEVLFEKERIIN